MPKGNATLALGRRLLTPYSLSHIQLDFYDEGSIHADVVGGREGIGPTVTTALRPVAGLQVVEARAWGAVAQAEHHPMAKSNPVDETRIADPVEPAKPQHRANVKKARKLAKARKGPTRKGAVRNGTKPATRKQTKQQTSLDLLGRREGATIEDLQQATGWQKHSVRGFLAGAVRKKLGLTLISEKPDGDPAAIAS